MTTLLALLTTVVCASASGPMTSEITELGPGVWRVRFGAPEAFTPNAMREQAPNFDGMKTLPSPPPLPFALNEITCSLSTSRAAVSIPCNDGKCPIYGFGLDPGAFNQRGLRKWLSVSASVVGKTGASHGPVPFYVSAEGYGVYVDTARVPFVHVARLSRNTSANETSATEAQGPLATSEAALYAARKASGRQEVLFDIPGHMDGIDIYLFGGPTIREAVQRYNLFSGGGCVPPMWGLGLKYRTHSNAVQEEVITLAQKFRDMRIPCDMFGLEPGWHTHAYSCSFVWSEKRFPDPIRLLDTLRAQHFRPNLWEHAYIHPTSPLYEPLKNKAGNFLVWDGLVVDFADPEASRIFAKYHEDNLIAKGVSGFKADECDRQPIDDPTPFNYPYCTQFPSGIEGDQMTQLYGYLYQRSILSAFTHQGLRTWGDVRATTALAAPLPFCLYSDAYEFDQYLRQLVNASFTGLLWSPEVREAATREETLNRIALCTLAPQMCIDVWFMPHPIWEQYNRVKNEKNDLLPPGEQEALAAKIRDLVNLRMSLLPYLYSAFWNYHEQGLPPVRALALDFPNDPSAAEIDDQFMFGESMMAAPYLRNACVRDVYFPAGTIWYDFHTHQRHAGGAKETISGEPGSIPLFVRDNSLIPVAAPVQYTAPETTFDITVQVFGTPATPFTLFEDDGEVLDWQKGILTRVSLTWANGQGAVARTGAYPTQRYQIRAWEQIQ